MKFKDLFKNKSTMATENTENDQELDETTLEANANGEQLIIDEAPVEDLLRDEVAKEKDKFIRLFAEFENYKKRTAKERIDQFKTANQDVLQALLPVMDDFDRALAEISKSGDEALVRGVELIHEKLKGILAQKGLEVVEVRSGDAFNADYAEAITQIPAPTPELKGKIVDVIEKGYKLGDKIIRYPKVVTGQ
ncbi:MAG: nucleotide exchange factor GrpE [Flavobacterium sp.]|nr:nucleotide exchange factor GrpE [Flavobacterium sp.]